MGITLWIWSLIWLGLPLEKLQLSHQINDYNFGPLGPSPLLRYIGGGVRNKMLFQQRVNNLTLRTRLIRLTDSKCCKLPTGCQSSAKHLTKACRAAQLRGRWTGSSVWTRPSTGVQTLSDNRRPYRQRFESTIRRIPQPDHPQLSSVWITL